jgi:uncharacterized protein
MAMTTEKVPMRDGVRLATDLYRPEGDGKYPTVLIRTPYDKKAVALAAPELTRRGFVLVAQDTRGRFASEGENYPFEGDGWWAGHTDGVDTVQWVRRQPWSDGKVGTWGASALGIAQLGLTGAGAKVDCQYIAVAATDQYQHAAFWGGCWRKALVEFWTASSKYAPDAAARWKAHPLHGTLWRDRSMASRFGQADGPAVHVGGWHDIFGQGTIESFLGYQNKGGRKARGRQTLVMGPWTHSIFSEKAGELTYPGAAKPPFGTFLDWEFFECHLKGASNRWSRPPAVVYYAMGAAGEPGAPGNEWRTSATWPPPGVKSREMFLTGERGLSVQRPGTGDPVALSYDPAAPCPTVGGPQLTIPGGPMDQRKIEARPDVLTFTGDALDRPLELTGRVRATIYLTTDAPDGDLVVRLCDVYPDGRSMNICEGYRRLRLWKSFERETPLRPGQPFPVEIDLWSTSIILNRGHRLRVQIAHSSYPAIEKSPHAARSQILTSGRFASKVTLPVLA